MNVALVQYDIHAGRRSRNLARARDMVRCAASFDPAPDLIVLPGACDVGDQPEALEGVTRAMCQGFAQSMATFAREWGLWIACGHAMVKGRWRDWVVSVFDPDGDTFFRYPTATRDDSPGKLTPAPSALGVMVAGPMTFFSTCDSDTLRSADIALLLSGPHVPVEGDQIIANVARQCRYVCAAAPANADRPFSSRVVDHEGRIAASLQPGQTGVAHVEIDIPLRLAHESTASSFSNSEDG